MLCISPSSCSQTKTSLDEIHVDFSADVHAVLELTLIIAFGSLCLNVLLNSVDLRLVLDEFLFDFIESVVDRALQKLVLLGITSHRVECHLLLQTLLIYLQEVLDLLHAVLLLSELCFETIGSSELVIHFILHLLNFLFSLLHFFLNSSFKILHLLEIALDCLTLNL